jgi:hypothetical protein
MDDAGFNNTTTSRKQTRNRECKKAMRTLFARTLALAISSGWTEAEASLFIAEVADEHILKLYRSKTSREHADDHQSL